MSVYAVPFAQRAAAQALLPGVKSVPLVDATGATVTFLGELPSAPTATDAAIVALGGSVYPDWQTAILANGTRIALSDAVTADLLSKAGTALATNTAFLGAAAGITAPLTNGQMNALVAQVVALTKQSDALIQLRLLSGTNLGT